MDDLCQRSRIQDPHPFLERWGVENIQVMFRSPSPPKFDCVVEPNGLTTFWTSLPSLPHVCPQV